MTNQEHRERASAKVREVFNEILTEREYQKQRWGAEHDAKHTEQDWLSILTVWLGKAASTTHPYAFLDAQLNVKKDKEAFRKRLIQIAAISLAAIEALDE